MPSQFRYFGCLGYSRALDFVGVSYSIISLLELGFGAKKKNHRRGLESKAWIVRMMILQ